MMLTCTAEELSFLKTLSAVTDKSSALADKLCIYISDGKLYFVVQTENMFAYREMKSEENDSSFFYPMANFMSILDSCEADDVIEFMETGVKIGESEFNFELQAVKLPSITKQLSKIEKSGELTTIFNVHLINELSPYVGSQKLEVLAWMRGHFAASDGSICAAFKAIEKSDDRFFFLPKSFLRLSSLVKDEELTISKIEDEFFVFTLGDVTVLSHYPKSGLIDFFSESFQAKHHRQINCQLDSKSFKKAIKRIYSSAKNNRNFRVFLTFSNGKVCIDNRDFNKSKEYVQAAYDPSLENHEILISSYNLSKVANSLNGEIMKFGIEPSAEAVSIRITDDEEKAQFYCILQSA